MVRANLERVRARIAAAARSVRREPAGVRLICVTKGVPVEQILEAAAGGIREIGENRVQEAQSKRIEIGTRYRVPGPDFRWHLIGRLQRNKVKFAVELFDAVHSVDSLELIEALERQAGIRQAQGERKLEILLQVNVSGEATKGGCRPDQVEELTEAVLRSGHLKWAGLMTMAPFSENPEEARPFFRQLRRLRDQLQDRMHVSPLDLSMGMSQDFEVAIQEGATMVRVGTAIFGEGI